jgi:hypothetical protein
MFGDKAIEWLGRASAVAARKIIRSVPLYCILIAMVAEPASSPTPLLPRSGFVQCAGCPRPALSPPFIASIGQDGWRITLSAKAKRLILTFPVNTSS